METVESGRGWRYTALVFIIVLLVVALLGALGALLSRLLTQESTTILGAVLLVLLGFMPMLLALLLAAWIAARFVQRFYALPRLRDSWDLLEYLLSERPEIPPTISLVRQGKVQHGDVILERYGGPGEMFVTSDSVVILEKAGKLTRMVRGPAVVELDHFEKVWDVLELRPHRWVFEVHAITKDGIPIVYSTDVRFQIDLSGTPEEQDAAIWKAAACKWVRDAWRTEPDRLMTWPKRVIIGATEGNMRTLLAQYDLDQLLDEASRAELRQKLIAALTQAVSGMGVRLLGVELGDIKLKDKILQQWIETWRAEKTREMHVRIAEGMAQRAYALEAARAQVRRQILEESARQSQALREKTVTADGQPEVSLAEAKQELRRRMWADFIARLRQALDNDAALLEALEEGAVLPAEKQRIFAQLVMLSCIEVIKQTDFSLEVFLPNDVLRVLRSVREHLEGKFSSTGKSK